MPNVGLRGHTWGKVRPRSRLVCAVLIVGTTLCGPVSPASAQVPRIQGQGTAASAMGSAFAAQADDPSALHYNPAGMPQLRGVQFLAGGLVVSGTTSFTSVSGTSATGDRDGLIAWPPPAHGYLTANLKDLGISAIGDLAVGVGVTVPFGSISRWPDNGPFRTVTTFSSLPLLDIKPTLAYQLTKDLAVGLGADIYTFAGFWAKGTLSCNLFRRGEVCPQDRRSN